MKTETKKRIQKLIGKVIELQENAPSDISYTLCWSGRSNTLSFSKFSHKDGAMDTILSIYCYPDENYGEISFDAFENVIKGEFSK